MSCKQCGKCCTPNIRINLELLEQYIKTAFPDGYTLVDAFDNDLVFIHKYLLANEITHKEAIKRNPLLKDWLAYDSHVFVCPFLNEDNKCEVHQLLKPNGMCDSFPYEKGKLITKIRYSEDCGYLKDEGR